MRRRHWIEIARKKSNRKNQQLANDKPLIFADFYKYLFEVFYERGLYFNLRIFQRFFAFVKPP